MTDLIQAIAELRRVTPPNSPWEAGDIGVGSSPVDYHIATILNAVISGDLIPKAEIEKALSDPTSVHYSMLKGTIAKPTLAQIIHLYGGDLIPRADADLAVALMVEKAADIVGMCDQVGADAEGPVRALAPASALSELQALRDLARLQFDGLLADATKMWGARCDAVTARAEAAEAANATLRAQVERLTGALTRQGDNMAFVVNHFTLPDAYYDKFIRELGEDRAALTEGAAP